VRYQCLVNDPVHLPGLAGHPVSDTASADTAINDVLNKQQTRTLHDRQAFATGESAPPRT